MRICRFANGPMYTIGRYYCHLTACHSITVFVICFRKSNAARLDKIWFHQHTEHQRPVSLRGRGPRVGEDQLRIRTEQFAFRLSDQPMSSVAGLVRRRQGHRPAHWLRSWTSYLSSRHPLRLGSLYLIYLLQGEWMNLIFWPSDNAMLFKWSSLTMIPLGSMNY